MANDAAMGPAVATWRMDWLWTEPDFRAVEGFVLLAELLIVVDSPPLVQAQHTLCMFAFSRSSLVLLLLSLLVLGSMLHFSKL